MKIKNVPGRKFNLNLKKILKKFTKKKEKRIGDEK